VPPLAVMNRTNNDTREKIAMSSIELEPEAIAAAAAAIPDGQPFVMLNLLRYREQADYGDHADETPCSGREAYHGRYVPAFGQIAPEGIQLFWYGGVLAGLVGPSDERWDEVALVRYPSYADFRRVVEDPRYLVEADPHRRAALADLRLIAIAEAS